MTFSARNCWGQQLVGYDLATLQKWLRFPIGVRRKTDLKKLAESLEGGQTHWMPVHAQFLSGVHRYVLASKATVL